MGRDNAAGGNIRGHRRFDILLSQQTCGGGFYDKRRRRAEKGKLVEQKRGGGLDRCGDIGCDSFFDTSWCHGSLLQDVFQLAAELIFLLCEITDMQWYVLRVASNKEEQVKQGLLQKVQREGLAEVVGRIEVPVEKVKRIRGNRQTIQKRKLYPGYVFLEMEPEHEGRVPEKVWFMIKETAGAGDFVGMEGMPTPMRDTDVAKVFLETRKADDAPSIQVEFKKGDHIKIREGAFENFEGVVDSIDAERGIVKVIVTIFGRSTPLDIEYWQIEKV